VRVGVREIVGVGVIVGVRVTVGVRVIVGVSVVVGVCVAGIWMTKVERMRVICRWRGLTPGSSSRPCTYKV